MDSRGFTLPDIVVALLIAALLAAIALPSFADAIRRSRRAEAVAALNQLQLAQERWRADNAAYSSDLAELGQPSATPNGHYTIHIVSADDRTHVASASAVGTQARDESCTVLTLQLSGGVLRYTSTDAHGSESAAVPNLCWTP